MATLTEEQKKKMITLEGLSEFKDKLVAMGLGDEEIIVGTTVEIAALSNEEKAGKVIIRTDDTVENINIATIDDVGLVRPDGTTITIDPDGTLHGHGGSNGTSNWDDLNNKPFEELSEDFNVSENKITITNNIKSKLVNLDENGKIDSKNTIYNKTTVNNELNNINDRLSESADWLKSANLYQHKYTLCVGSKGGVSADTAMAEPIELNGEYTVLMLNNPSNIKIDVEYYNSIEFSSNQSSSSWIEDNQPHTFNTLASTKYVRVLFRVESGTITDSMISGIKIMIAKGNSITEYQPFSKSNAEMTETLSELYEDGFARVNLVEGIIYKSAIVSGGGIWDNNTYSMAYAKIEQGETYTFRAENICFFGFFETKPQIGATAYADRVLSDVNPYTFVAPISGYVAFRIDINFNEPMCVKGDMIGDYVPYAESNVELTAKLSHIEEAVNYNATPKAIESYSNSGFGYDGSKNIGRVSLSGCSVISFALEDSINDIVIKYGNISNTSSIASNKMVGFATTGTFVASGLDYLSETNIRTNYKDMVTYDSISGIARISRKKILEVLPTCKYIFVNYIENTDTITLDSTLDAGMVTAELSQLDNDFPLNGFVQGAYTGSVGGSYSTNTSELRIRVPIIKTKGGNIGFSIPSGYRIAVMSANDSNKVVDDIGWISGETSVTISTSATQLLLTVGKSDNTAITPNSVASLKFVVKNNAIGSVVSQITEKIVDCKVYKSNQKVVGTTTLKLPCPNGDFLGMLALPAYSESAVEANISFYTITRTDTNLHVNKSLRAITSASANNGVLTLTFDANLSNFVKWVCYPM